MYLNNLNGDYEPINHSSYRFSQMKAKMRKGQNKTEGRSKSPKIIKKAISNSLKKSLKI